VELAIARWEMTLNFVRKPNHARSEQRENWSMIWKSVAAFRKDQTQSKAYSATTMQPNLIAL